MIDTKDWTVLHAYESFGGGDAHVRGVEIRVKFSRQEDVDHLKERHDLDLDCASKDVSYLMYRVADEIKNGVENAFASRDPDVIAKAAATRARFCACFKDAGFDPIFVETIPNEYFKDAYGLRSPWLTVTTRVGHFKVGWRKRVIALDWSRTTVTKTATQMFQQEYTTKGDRDIHAWSYEALTKYLRIIGEAG